MRRNILLIGLLVSIIFITGCTSCNLSNAKEHQSEIADSKGECYDICKGYGSGWNADPESSYVGGIGIFYQCNCYKC